MRTFTIKAPVAVAAVSLLAVLVVLAVVAFVVWRQDVAADRFRESVQECMEFRGLDTFDPDMDGVEFANQAAECGEMAQRNG